MTPTPSTTGPESIVTSTEWSRRLKEAGWKIEWSWMFREGYMLGDDGEPTSWLIGHGRQPHDKHTLPAPSAEEILRRLPKVLSNEAILEWDAWRCTLQYVKRNDQGTEYVGRQIPKQAICENSLANAAASMFVWLAENNLLPVDSPAQ